MSTTTDAPSAVANGHESKIKDNAEASSASSLHVLGMIKNIEKIDEQRRIFLDQTITEEPPTQAAEDVVKPLPPNTLALNVKYATLPGPSTTALRSPLSPPPKPPMLSRTRSIGSGDGRTPNTPAGEINGLKASSGETTVVAVQLRHSLVESETAKPVVVEALEPIPTVSAKHYEGLIEELRCPGCASAMKAPVLLCKSGHSVCEQCTRILLMCPLCKEPFTNSRSLTVEALCAKAHFRCSNASGGCTVRMPVALLPWHEKQCIYKPMKCFMGRVWGDCKWHGREVQWKEHLELEHTDKMFVEGSVDLVWDMVARRKPLAGYYVFQVHEEMFNFYEIYDKQRVLFTMTCTSNRRETKYNYAYEVTLVQPDNEALSLTQKFPVHSEYDRDILMEGTCVSYNLSELSRFVDEEKLLNYRVSVVAVKSPRKTKPARAVLPRQSLPIDYQQTTIAGVNGKCVPSSMIITRTYKEAIGEPDTPSTEDGSESLELERKWGTPQLHFNRKYLKASASDPAGDIFRDDGREDELKPLAQSPQSANNDDKVSLCSSGTTSYTKKVSNSLRKSFRALKSDIIEMRPFSKKGSPEKLSPNGNTNGK